MDVDLGVARGTEPDALPLPLPAGLCGVGGAAGISGAGVNAVGVWCFP